MRTAGGLTQAERGLVNHLLDSPIGVLNPLQQQPNRLGRHAWNVIRYGRQCRTHQIKPRKIIECGHSDVGTDSDPQPLHRTQRTKCDDVASADEDIRPAVGEEALRTLLSLRGVMCGRQYRET